jgi:hypothetical protein
MMWFYVLVVWTLVSMALGPFVGAFIRVGGSNE